MYYELRTDKISQKLEVENGNAVGWKNRIKWQLSVLIHCKAPKTPDSTQEGVVNFPSPG